MLGLLFRAKKPEAKTETPVEEIAVEVPYKYTADDLPRVIYGRVTAADLANTNYRRAWDACAVAMALRRMYPGIEDTGSFHIGVEEHRIGSRLYHADHEGRAGIMGWSMGRDYEFDFTLTEIR